MNQYSNLLTVLVVDDEPTIRLTLRATLESASYRVIEAENGQKALDMLERESPAAVLLDLSMPVMDGMGFLQYLRTSDLSHRPPVVVLTAYGSMAAAVKALKIGARDFIEKPATPDEVRGAVAAAIKEHRSAQIDATETKADIDYDAGLRLIRDALRAGRIKSAEQLLIRIGAITPHGDASFLNLTGVLHEASGRTESARRFYGRAIRVDSSYGPAQQNMRRMYEFTTIGHCREAVALGDELKFLIQPPPAPFTPPSLLRRLRELLHNHSRDGESTAGKKSDG